MMLVSMLLFGVLGCGNKGESAESPSSPPAAGASQKGAGNNLGLSSDTGSAPVQSAPPAPKPAPVTQ
jgi:hypothetical protein